MKRNNWTDDPCYYVSIVDGSKHGLVAGPFREHQQALDLVEAARLIGRKIDPKSHFYGWGTCKTMNGYREGILNRHLGVKE